MIRSLRRRHLRVFCLLLLMVPAAFWAGLQSRKAPAVMSALPDPLGPDSLLADAQELAEQTGAWDPPLVASRLFSHPQRGLLVELIPRGDLKQPDVLLYWTAESSLQGTALPSSLHLLGSFAGRLPEAYPLPSEAHAGGRLILYSLAHQEILSSVRLSSDLLKRED